MTSKESGRLGEKSTKEELREYARRYRQENPKKIRKATYDKYHGKPEKYKKRW